MVKAIIFDVDGVLLDTVPYHFRAWKKLFTKQNIAFSFKDYLAKVNGLPRLTGIANIIPSANKITLERLASLKQEYLTRMISETPPKPLPGVISLLKKLKKKNLKLAAASSSKNAPLLLKKTGLSSYLSIIVSGNDFKKSKPDPELFLLTSKKLGVDPHLCVVVEDALVGIQAAKAAGMKTIGILSSNDKALLKTADICLSSLKEEQKILKFLL